MLKYRNKRKPFSEYLRLSNISNRISAPKSLLNFLSRFGYGEKFRLLPLVGGANNRVFRLDCNSHSFLLKHYFNHPRDPTDRLQVEFSFLSFAWERGVRSIPQPYACDQKNHFAIYEFIQGLKLQARELTEKEINQVLALFFEINRYKNEKPALQLSPEKEACFTLAQHLKCIERRVALLKKIHVFIASPISSSQLLQKAQELIWEKIVPAWKTISCHILKESASAHLELEREIHPEDRCLSHSDIGFHNALRRQDGKLCFVDFEYAGWGDPAKMVCDFFSAPKLPVPIKYFKYFSESVARGLKEPEKFLKRVNLLLPLYRLKWCCILMNDFLPVDSSRRQFSLGKSSKKNLQKQLKKVQDAVCKISDGIH